MTSSQQGNPANAFVWRGRTIRGLIFDMDGTIVETKDPHADAWEIWAEKHGVGVDRETYIRELYGRSNMEVMPLIFPHLAEDMDALLAIANECEVIFQEHMKRGDVPPVDGLLEIVERARKRGLPMAVASSAPRENVELITSIYELQEAMPHRFGADDVAEAKPAPDLFLKAADALGLPPEECLVFEDSRYGFEAARRAGCAVIAILTLHTAEEVVDWVDDSAPTFADLLQTEAWVAF